MANKAVVGKVLATIGLLLAVLPDTATAGFWSVGPTRKAPPPPPPPPPLSAAPPSTAVPVQQPRRITPRTAPVEAPPGKPAIYAPGEWLLAEAAMLKAQPTLQSEAVLRIPVGAAVVAQGNVTNNEGGWWFVNFQGRVGWLRESALNNAGRP